MLLLSVIRFFYSKTFKAVILDSKTYIFLIYLEKIEILLPSAKAFLISAVVYELIHCRHHISIQELKASGKILKGKFDDLAFTEATYMTQIEMMNEKRGWVFPSQLVNITYCF